MLENAVNSLATFNQKQTFLIVICVLILLLLSMANSFFRVVLDFCFQSFHDPSAKVHQATNEAPRNTQDAVVTEQISSRSEDREQPPTKRSLILGFLLIFLFFGGFITWFATAPLESAAVAPGFVNLDTYRKTVQHLEGGIVKEIRVREGQAVKKDQILVVLDDAQTRSQIRLHEARLASIEDQLSLISHELQLVEQLHQKGLTTTTRVLALKRRKVELKGERIQTAAQIEAATDILGRLNIRSPIDGTIVNLQIHTLGGVLKPGDALLSIVPFDEPLVIEARVDTNDIDVVHKDLSAQIRLTPLNARMIPPLTGRVVWVSADRMTDTATGSDYYLARVVITDRPENYSDEIKLYPGMPAEVIIKTGEHTFLAYLFAPLSRSFRRAFTEE